MYGYLNLINKTAAQTSVQQQEQMQQQQPVHEAYVQQSQNEDHVFYSSDDQPDYYGEDYYGAEYDDDGDDVSHRIPCYEDHFTNVIDHPTRP